MAGERTGTVAFDIIGTLFSLERPRSELMAIGAPAHALDLWFAGALRDAFAWSHAGDYRPLKDVLEATLPRTLAQLGVEVKREDSSAVMRSLAELEPVDGAEEACRMLRDTGWRLLALTNGSEEFTRALLERAALADRFDRFLSCDSIRKTKPHPEVYEMAKREAAGQLWLIAAHGWDVAGAARAGLRTAWIGGQEREYLSIWPEPDVRASTVREAAERLLRAA